MKSQHIELLQGVSLGMIRMTDCIFFDHIKAKWSPAAVTVAKQTLKVLLSQGMETKFRAFK